MKAFIYAEMLRLLRSVQCSLDGVAASLCVAKQHASVGGVEHWVRDVGVTASHTALHDDDLLALVCVDDGHTGDGARL